MKRASMIVFFWATLFVSLGAVIDAYALPYGVGEGIPLFEAPPYSEVPLQQSEVPQVVEAPQYGATGGEIMMASYYDYGHAGNMTASGDIFDPMMFTAAHKTMPFGTRLLVSHGGRSVEVVVNDRGPYVDGRDLDLSLAAADAIGLTGLGVAPVEVVVL